MSGRLSKCCVVLVAHNSEATTIIERCIIQEMPLSPKAVHLGLQIVDRAVAVENLALHVGDLVIAQRDVGLEPRDLGVEVEGDVAELFVGPGPFGADCSRRCAAARFAAIPSNIWLTHNVLLSASSCPAIEPSAPAE